MDNFPAPPRGRASGSGRGRGRGHGRGSSRGRGQQPFNRQKGAEARGRGHSPSSRRTGLCTELPGNHERYIHNSEDGEHSSSEEGLDFEVAASTGFHMETLDGDNAAFSTDDVLMRELGVDFGNLAQALRSVPQWIRLGGEDRIRIALGEPKSDDISTLFTCHTSDTGSGVSIDDMNRTHPRNDLLAELDAVDIDSEATSGAKNVASPGVDIDDDDDFDAWLDKA